MLEIKLIANLPSVEKLKEFIKDIRQNVIKIGLDKPLERDVKQLKEELKRLIDTKSQKIDNERIIKDKIQQEVRYSVSEEVALKQLTGADITKYNKAEEFSDLINSKLAIIHTWVQDKTNNPEGHMGVRFKATTGSFDADLNQLAENLNKSTFMFINPDGTKEYVVNSGLDLKKYLKVWCTRDTGDTDKARKRHEYLKDKYGYVEWRLTEEGIKQIKNKGVHITSILASTAQGNFGHAATIFPHGIKNPQQLDKLEEIRSKLKDLVELKDISGNAEVFSNVVTLINNLKIIKEQKTDKILNYRLVSSYSTYSPADWKADSEFVMFFEEFNRQTRTWIAVNQMPWFFELVKKTSQIIRKYES